MTCTTCNEERPEEQFYLRERSRNGQRFRQCKSCVSSYSKARHAARTPEQLARKSALQKERWYKTEYGITRAEFDQMVDIQGGKCACCHLAPSGKGAAAVLNVDHDHETGRVRGLLCNPCNQAMGLMKDNPAMIRQLLAYAHYAVELRAVA